MRVGIIGAGTMGTGIAQVAGLNGAEVLLFDARVNAASQSRAQLEKITEKLVEKGKLDAEKRSAFLACVGVKSDLAELASCDLVIEAIVEDLRIKQELFRTLEEIISPQCILATNTSSLSIAALAGALQTPERFIGIHFFNPPALMQLVEIIPGIRTDRAIIESVERLIAQWGKIGVRAADIPGFIVNRVARPFYGEALRIAEERIAEPSQIDRAMRELGQFRMGPFELMDLIGNDINFAVTESVFHATFFDPRYRPSILQRRMVEAGLLGRKTAHGYYRYDGEGKRLEQETPVPENRSDREIFERILAMLINEAAEMVRLQLASPRDIDLAVTKGVNYPKGLLQWADEIGIEKIVEIIARLQSEYQEDRYRISPLLRDMATRGENFSGRLQA